MRRIVNITGCMRLPVRRGRADRLVALAWTYSSAWVGDSIFRFVHLWRQRAGDQPADVRVHATRAVQEDPMYGGTVGCSPSRCSSAETPVPSGVRPLRDHLAPVSSMTSVSSVSSRSWRAKIHAIPARRWPPGDAVVPGFWAVRARPRPGWSPAAVSGQAR
jgi:hypothetical protein